MVLFFSQARWRVLQGCSAALGRMPVFLNAGSVMVKGTALMGVTNLLQLAVVNSSSAYWIPPGSNKRNNTFNTYCMPCLKKESINYLIIPWTHLFPCISTQQHVWWQLISLQQQSMHPSAIRLWPWRWLWRWVRWVSRMWQVDWCCCLTFNIRWCFMNMP